MSKLDKYRIGNVNSKKPFDYNKVKDEKKIEAQNDKPFYYDKLSGLSELKGQTNPQGNFITELSQFLFKSVKLDKGIKQLEGKQRELQAQLNGSRYLKGFAGIEDVVDSAVDWGVKKMREVINQELELAIEKMEKKLGVDFASGSAVGNVSDMIQNIQTTLSGGVDGFVNQMKSVSAEMFSIEGQIKEVCQWTIDNKSPQWTQTGKDYTTGKTMSGWQNNIRQQFIKGNDVDLGKLKKQFEVCNNNSTLTGADGNPTGYVSYWGMNWWKDANSDAGRLYTQLNTGNLSNEQKAEAHKFWKNQMDILAGMQYKKGIALITAWQKKEETLKKIKSYIYNFTKELWSGGEKSTPIAKILDNMGKNLGVNVIVSPSEEKTITVKYGDVLSDAQLSDLGLTGKKNAVIPDLTVKYFEPNISIQFDKAVDFDFKQDRRGYWIDDFGNRIMGYTFSNVNSIPENALMDKRGYYQSYDIKKDSGNNTYKVHEGYCDEHGNIINESFKGLFDNQPIKKFSGQEIWLKYSDAPNTDANGNVIGKCRMLRQAFHTKTGQVALLKKQLANDNIYFADDYIEKGKKKFGKNRWNEWATMGDFVAIKTIRRKPLYLNIKAPDSIIGKMDYFQKSIDNAPQKVSQVLDMVGQDFTKMFGTSPQAISDFLNVVKTNMPTQDEKGNWKAGKLLNDVVGDVFSEHLSMDKVNAFMTNMDTMLNKIGMDKVKSPEDFQAVMKTLIPDIELGDMTIGHISAIPDSIADAVMTMTTYEDVVIAETINSEKFLKGISDYAHQNNVLTANLTNELNKLNTDVNKQTEVINGLMQKPVSPKEVQKQTVILENLTQNTNEFFKTFSNQQQQTDKAMLNNISDMSDLQAKNVEANEKVANQIEIMKDHNEQTMKNIFGEEFGNKVNKRLEDTTTYLNDSKEILNSIKDISTEDLTNFKTYSDKFNDFFLRSEKFYDNVEPTLKLIDATLRKMKVSETASFFDKMVNFFGLSGSIKAISGFMGNTMPRLEGLGEQILWKDLDIKTPSFVELQTALKEFEDNFKQVVNPVPVSEYLKDQFKFSFDNPSIQKWIEDYKMDEMPKFTPKLVIPSKEKLSQSIYERYGYIDGKTLEDKAKRNVMKLDDFKNMTLMKDKDFIENIDENKLSAKQKKNLAIIKKKLG